MDELGCFFDISIGRRDKGRVVFKLFHDQCPKTCENFKCLCTGEKGLGKKSGKPLHYKGTRFHRVVRNFIIQGGDITDGNGKGGDSIYDGSFVDENLTLVHDEPFLLSMANRGPDTNRSQFFITTKEAPHLDGKHVVFGKVVSGFDVIKDIENREVDSNSRPIEEILIRDCGQVAIREDIQKSVSSDRGRKRKLSVSSRSSVESSPRLGRSRESSSSSTSTCSSSNSQSSFSSGSSSSSSSSRTSRSSSSSQSKTNDGSSSRSSTSGGSCSSGQRDPEIPRKDAKPLKRELGASEAKNKSSFNQESAGKISDQMLHNEKSKQSAIKTPKDREDETNVNPHYKCSVKPDEVPEIPINRFLLRGPPEERHLKRDSHKVDTPKDDKSPPVPIEATIDDGVDSGNDIDASNTLKSQIKPAEPLVSKSGRIMRGRGNFKFRTPSPESNSGRRFNRHRDRYSSKHSFKSPRRSRSPARRYYRDDDSRRNRSRRD